MQLETRIPITKNQADAIRADITEINQLIQLLQVKQAANRRMTDTIIRDADQDPADFPKYELEEKGGKFFLKRAQDQFINGAPLEAPAETAVKQ